MFRFRCGDLSGSSTLELFKVCTGWSPGRSAAQAENGPGKFKLPREGASLIDLMDFRSFDRGSFVPPSQRAPESLLILPFALLEFVDL